MLENYINSQPIITKLLINSINNNKLVQAYLFVSNDKDFLMQFSLDFSKKIINPNNDKSINTMIENKKYPELKIIEPTNNVIKKEELYNLQHYFSLKPTIGKKLVYIISSADKFNLSSANSILKFLEEPNEDIVAILLTDNLTKVLPTIKSRCQVLIFNNTNEETYDKYYFYDNYNIDCESTEDFDKKYYNAIDIIKRLENNKINLFMHHKDLFIDCYKTKEEMIFLIDLILYFYYDTINYLLKRNIIYMNDEIDLISEIANKNDLDILEKKVNIIGDIKEKLNTNMNIKLLIDELLIRFDEV